MAAYVAVHHFLRLFPLRAQVWFVKRTWLWSAMVVTKRVEQHFGLTETEARRWILLKLEHAEADHEMFERLKRAFGQPS